jgi:hypothetical protein
MPEFVDDYDGYYANRLWQLIPGVYRAKDSDDPTVTGPLQELVNRIGGQMAVVRRSIDRLWADQSIETSDDWVIPYIGDLLDTNLVNGLDARGRRLDVAKTIHYRRRKGTVAVLEEIARDVTGWDAHIVEGFRRLSRSRHNLDPAVGSLNAALPTPCAGSTAAADAPDPLDLLRHEGLVGELTGTPAGGFADLRSVHGANLADSPFDEYFHTADVRRGQDAVGRYGIPKLLVFLWRLQSFAVPGGTPVKVSGCPRQWVFDPTGRHIPLFLPPPPPEVDDWVDAWTSAAEWQVPGPLTTSLERAIADPGKKPPRHAPYPDAADLPPFYGAVAGAPPEPVDFEHVWPEAGQFELKAAPGAGFAVSYQYAFPASIGAGPYDRTLLGDPPAQTGTDHAVGGGAGLDTALDATGGTGTVTIGDSLTYDAVADVGTTADPAGPLLLRAGPQQRPVVRLPKPAKAADPPTAWVFTGGDPGADLTLDGLLVSGGDVVLRGAFGSVRLTGCTADPGTLDDTGAAYTQSADKRALAPVRIWIEADPKADADAPGAIGQLTIDHCVLGPVRTRNGGAVEQIAISDSLVQGIVPAGAGPSFAAADIYDPELLARGLQSADPLSKLLRGGMPAAVQTAIKDYKGGAVSKTLLNRLLAGLNAIVTSGTSVWNAVAFTGVQLTPEASTLLAEGAAADTAALNHALLESGYPVALSPAALAFSEGTVDLQRVSVLGRTFVHRLDASDTILADFAVAEDAQDGCIRFSSITTGSSLPSPYLSATTATGAALFTSTDFGNPAYGQLLETVDRAIVAAADGVTISAGADDGSEMGAFSSQLAPIKERGLLIKYEEFMPLGLTPVVVHVT